MKIECLKLLLKNATAQQAGHAMVPTCHCVPDSYRTVPEITRTVPEKILYVLILNII